MTTVVNGTESEVGEKVAELGDLDAALAEKGGLRAAFDALQTNVFVAGPDLVIRYANPCAVETLRRIEGELQEAFGVGVDAVVGGSIHRFHRDPKAVEA